jgi:hypothetical protein
MAIKVNLLKKTKVISESQYQLERKVLRGAMIGFVVVIALMVAVFGWNFVVTRRLSVAENTIKQAKVRLAGLNEATTQQLYLKSRLQKIKGFLATRSITREALQEILVNPVSGATISSITFEEDKRVLIQVEAQSPQIFDQVYAYYESSKDYFSQVVNRGVTRNKDGSYLVVLALDLPLEGK